jgi:hypothetical protein
MDRCDPTRRVHRECFTAWPERESYTRAQLEQLATYDEVAVFYRSATLVAALCVRSPELDDALVMVRHARALDLVDIPLAAWSDWMARREPTWSRSAHRDDLALFATELVALPGVEQIAATEPVQRLVARVAADSDRKHAAAMQLRSDNDRARALAARLHEHACPHCATKPVDARFIEGGELRRSYFICRGCGRSFVG